MKQFAKILKFELAGYLKNKIFVGVTVFAVIAIAAVMFFPRFVQIFPSDDTTDATQALSVMLVKTDRLEQADMIDQIFSTAFTGYEVRVTSEETDIFRSPRPWQCLHALQ